VIEDVEGVQCDGEDGTVFLFLFETAIVLDVEIEIDEAGAVECIARRETLVGTIIEDAVTVGVEAGDDV
jgi:hypothetical protein